jgi:hypothetical protein
MSYAKLYKVCQDYGLGGAGVNNAITNLDAQKTLMGAEHGTDKQASVFVPGGPSDPYNAWGHHNTPHVPRAFVHCSIITSALATFGTYAGVLGGAIKQISRTGTGLWQVSMDSRLQLFFGHARAKWTTNADVNLCTCINTDLNGSGVGLYIQTLQLSAGDFVLTDFDFDLAVYSYS